MAGKEEEKDQKTHAPSPKKIEDAHKKGDVATSPELRQLAMFVGIIVTIGGVGSYATATLATSLARFWARADSVALVPSGAQRFGRFFLGEIAAGLMPLLATLFTFALLGGLAQGRPMLRFSRIAPKFSKINPFAGFKRMFGVKALVEFAKTLAKLSVVAGITGLILWPFLPGFAVMVGIGPGTIIDLARGIIRDVLISVAALVAAIAVLDFFYQRRSWVKKMMMSTKELRDEHKDQEGDPKVKGRRRQLAIQRSRQRMMATVPSATVVITNPTHFAVALKYDHGAMAAPIVVAMGADLIALKIREIAELHRVPRVENRPLARALYASAELDRPIPIEHYQAVAEVISYVLRLAQENGGAGR